MLTLIQFTIQTFVIMIVSGITPNQSSCSCNLCELLWLFLVVLLDPILPCSLLERCGHSHHFIKVFLFRLWIFELQVVTTFFEISTENLKLFSVAKHITFHFALLRQLPHTVNYQWCYLTEKVEKCLWLTITFAAEKNTSLLSPRPQAHEIIEKSNLCFSFWEYIIALIVPSLISYKSCHNLDHLYHHYFYYYWYHYLHFNLYN